MAIDATLRHELTPDAKLCYELTWVLADKCVP